MPTESHSCPECERLGTLYGLCRETQSLLSASHQMAVTHGDLSKASFFSGELVLATERADVAEKNLREHRATHAKSAAQKL